MSTLKLQSLGKVFGNTAAVEKIDLEVGEGEMVAFLGPSGCGKTTTLRMVAGFVEPSSGSILVGGKDITRLPPNRRNMGMVFQSYALFPHMNVSENVAFGLKARHVPKGEIAGRITAALELVGLSGYEARYPKELSGGQQQRVALARVLALRPQLLLFDEPLSNLDAKLRVQMRHEIRTLQQEVGITSLFVTHDQEEAMTIADRIVVMNKGRIEQVGPPAEIYDNPRTRFVADFIGAANLVEGRLEGDVFQSARGARLDCAPPDFAPTGAPVVLSIRPEKIEILPGAGEGGTPGTVMRATKLGGLIEYVVELASGDTILVQKQDRSPADHLRVGEPVRVSWNTNDARLLP
ncbi:ABC transporter ATP-binding protein [Acuticoccus sp. M5D2P5]|uniref:ABC transporter ATP-binding protein n=1 Tax=Acuticoccus kalidii TaxID=2910977 RepID=UPI001F477660|nr:ABC transporter ATP-binding protein [Acuticoccus kalidii]MCF3935703.1 ABC transporter ATP-binding protein [Acuticoccus kalidii]